MNSWWPSASEQVRSPLATASTSADYTVNMSGALGGGGSANSINAARAGSGVKKIQSISGQASWEIDIWGRLRHTAKATKADSEAAKADVETMRLTLQAQAAQSYFTLRAAWPATPSLWN